MLNKTILQGRLVKDVDLRQTSAGVPVTTFQIAVDRRYRKNAEKEVDFFNIVAWRGTAEFVSKYFSKGSPILIEGHLQARDYTDKDGIRKTIYEVIADEIHFCGSSRPPEEVKEESEYPQDEDDIPF